MNENVAKACGFLHAQGVEHLVGIISTGSGQEIKSENLRLKLKLKYSEVPGFGEPGIPGHEGMLRVVGGCDGDWAIWTGRRHFYQGFKYGDIGYYIDISREMGAGSLVCINAAGGLDPTLSVGDWVIVERYKCFIPVPVRERSFDGGAWAETSIPLAERIAEASLSKGITTKKGNYVGVPGPTYETAGEVAWLRSLGCHLVGMSTVSELIRAQERGMEAIALSMVANVHGSGKQLTHLDVVEAAEKSARQLAEIVGAFVSEG